jgi:hypothetical protein
MTWLTTGLAIAAVLLGPGPAVLHAEDDCLTLADFAHDPVGAFPSDWKVRKDEGKSVYTVQEESGRRFLHAASTGLGIQAALAREWKKEAAPDYPLGPSHRSALKGTRRFWTGCSGGSLLARGAVVAAAVVPTRKFAKLDLDKLARL